MKQSSEMHTRRFKGQPYQPAGFPSYPKSHHWTVPLRPCHLPPVPVPAQLHRPAVLLPEMVLWPPCSCRHSPGARQGGQHPPPSRMRVFHTPRLCSSSPLLLGVGALRACLRRPAPATCLSGAGFLSGLCAGGPLCPQTPCAWCASCVRPLLSPHGASCAHTSSLRWRSACAPCHCPCAHGGAKATYACVSYFHDGASPLLAFLPPLHGGLCDTA